MRQRRWKLFLIAAVILIVLAILLAVGLQKPKTPDPEEPTQGMDFDASQPTTEPPTETVEPMEPMELGSGLKLTRLSEVTGNFPEDGSDEFVESMLAATFLNEGDRTIQYASVKVTVGEETFSFVFSTLPEGKTVRVFEAEKKNATGAPDAVSAEIETIVYFPEEPSDYEQDLEITFYDGAILVKNRSEKDIEKEISVFYKTVSGDTFVGGITYRFRVPEGLASGESYRGNALHADDKMSKVMFVTYAE